MKFVLGVEGWGWDLVYQLLYVSYFFFRKKNIIIRLGLDYVGTPLYKSSLPYKCYNILEQAHKQI